MGTIVMGGCDVVSKKSLIDIEYYDKDGIIW